MKARPARMGGVIFARSLGARSLVADAQTVGRRDLPPVAGAKARNGGQGRRVPSAWPGSRIDTPENAAQEEGDLADPPEIDSYCL